jgi:ABC-type Fe2+-enterobactin transport system substrate-binding protein|tara:strand:- start:2275 stop:2565 length:291 start_codon:yes stop_codon:yes gene_type:complete
MMKTSYEATEGQRQLAKLGRAMMDYSETASMAKLKDKDIAQYNTLSDVGHMLTTIGSLFGPKFETISKEHKQVMADFIKFKGANLPQGGPCLRTTF